MPETENKNKNQIKQDFHIVMEELVNPDKAPQGRPRKLTMEMFNEFLYWLFLTGEYKWAAIRSKMGLKTFEDYQKQSPYFAGLAEAARNDGLIRARMNIISSVRGQEEVKNPETGVVESKAVSPNIEDSKWLLQYEDRIGNNKGAEGGDAPSLGVPKNEREAELLAMVLNKHSDYEQSKRKDTES